MLRDVMRETWAYQNTPHEGHEEEPPQRFQQAFLLAKKQTVNTEDSAILRDLIIKMSIAQTTEDAVIYLLDVDEDEVDED